MPLAPDEDLWSRNPQIFQPNSSLAEAASTELPLSVEDMDQDIYPVNGSTLDIQGFNNSNQGAHGLRSSPYTPEQLNSRAASSGVVHPSNISYGGSTVNVSANTSFPNNSMGQNLQTRFPTFSDPFDYELEKLTREQLNLKKISEEKTLKIKDEVKKTIDEIRSEYDRNCEELDAEYNAIAMEQEANSRVVIMGSLLAKAFVSKCSENTAAADLAALRARSFQHSIQQPQEAPVPNQSDSLLHRPRLTPILPRPISQQNTQMNPTTPRPSVTAVEAPIPNTSGPPLHNPRYTVTQPRPVSQQAAVQTHTHMNSTALPRSSVTTAEAPILNPPGPSRFPGHNTTQPRPASQQAAIQTNTMAPPRPSMNSTAPPRPSVTAAEAPILNPPGPSRFPGHNTTQPRPASQQAAIQTNTTAPPRPSMTAEKAPIPNQSGPSHIPDTTTQPRPASQQAAIQTNTTAPPRPSTTAEKAPIPNQSGPSNTPLNTTTQPRPIPQQASVQSNTPRPRPPVPAEPLPFPSPLSNRPQSRGPLVVANLNASSYSATSTPPVYRPVRNRPPHLRSPRPPPNSAPRLVPEQQQQHRNSNEDK